LQRVDHEKWFDRAVWPSFQALLQGAKKIWSVLAASPTQAFTEMQAGVFNARQAFTALEMSPATADKDCSPR
jgi:hypothetical protein